MELHQELSPELLLEQNYEIMRKWQRAYFRHFCMLIDDSLIRPIYQYNCADIDNRTLNQSLLNILSLCTPSTDLENISLKDRGKIIYILLASISGMNLLHGPLGRIHDNLYRDAIECVQTLCDLKTNLIEWYEPLSKFYDIERSYTSTINDSSTNKEKLWESTAFIEKIPESRLFVEQIAQIFVDYQGISEVNDTIKQNIIRILRASIKYGYQFSILSYCLTAMIIQKPEVFQAPVDPNYEGSDLYTIRLQKGIFRLKNQDKHIELFLKIQKVIKECCQTYVPSQELLKSLPPQERLLRMLQVKDSIFEATKITYIPTKTLLEILKKSFQLSQNQLQWIGEKWNALFFYRSPDGTNVNKIEVIKMCDEYPIGKVIVDLNTLLHPRNRIRFLMHNFDELSSETFAQIDKNTIGALNRLYESSVVGNQNANATLYDKYSAVESAFQFQHLDISLLAFRMQSCYVFIDETEWDPLEEILAETIRKGAKQLLQDYTNTLLCYLPNEDVGLISADIQGEVGELLASLKKKVWNKEIAISFLTQVDMRRSTLFEDLICFFKNQLNKTQQKAFVAFREKPNKVQDYYILQLFSIAMEKIVELIIREVLLLIWTFAHEGGFFISLPT